MNRRFPILASTLMLGAMFYMSGCVPSPDPGSGSNTTATQSPDAENHEHEGDSHDGHLHGDDAHIGDAQSENSHEGHAHEGEQPAYATYAEAVQALSAARNEIASALEAGESKKADNLLHQVGHTLEVIPKLAEKDIAGEEDVKAVKGAVEDLFGYLGKIDEEFHGGKGIEYAEVEKPVDEAIKVLLSKVKKEE